MNPEALLQQAQRPLLIAHIAPDGDAIGSVLGLGWALKEMGRQPTLACADPVPDGLRFLPGSAEIVARRSGEEDLVISLDSSDLRRLGSLYDEALFARLPVLNIDHHITNIGFGSVQLVEPAAASTAQIVYGLLRRLGWPLSPWAATCLLTGLVTDTRSFRTSSTDAEALRTALALMEAGAPLAEINEHLTHDLSLGIVHLWGKVLGSVQLKDGITWAEVSRETLRDCGVAPGDTTGLVNFIAGIRQARVAVLFAEKPDGQIDVGMRSLPTVDVSGIARALGGGGHRQAAGCTLPGPLDVARSIVLQALVSKAALIEAGSGKLLGDNSVGRSMPLST